MNALAIIFAYANNDKLKELTEKRTPASVPIGGRYRVVDFALSNMINSNITKVGIITRNNYQSLMDHVGNGKEWDLSRKRDGLYILPPYAQYDSNMQEYGGWIDALSAAMTFIRRSREKYVVLTTGEYVCNIDYEEVLAQHEKSEADITCIYRRDDRGTTGDIAYTLEGDRITDVLLGAGVEGEQNMSMDMFIIERQMLENLVREAAMRGQKSLARDIIRRHLNTLKIFGYEFKGYARRVDSVQAYMQINMDMLQEDVREELFNNPNGRIYTKVRDEMPAQYLEGARVRNSLVADGCIIEGEVENCVLARGVRIGKGAKVSNSIILQKSEVLAEAHLEHVIVDKDAIVRTGRTLIGRENLPVLIGKGMVI
ncbi:MAG: glucose-1-phosphate adenylyltransferase subunit GlgD [Eubacteriales bacterium]|nr:glucose-1-phosphate adenylyltransferase subunit GlgD [Eubacteriales bacterium]